MFSYRPENEEVLRTVRFMVEQLLESGRVEGDCDDAAIFLAASFVALGVPTRFVAIRYGGSPGFRHVFIEFYSGVWVRVDPTVGTGTIHQEDERMIVNV